MSKRNRIVINLDPNAPQSDGSGGTSARRRRGGAGRVLTIIGVILIVFGLGIAAVGYFGWQRYTSKPSYSLALLIDAAQRNDNAEIDRLLDIDKITESFISQVRQRASSSSSTVGSLSFAQIDRAAAAAAPRLKQTLHDQLPAEIKRLSQPAAGKPFALIALGVPFMMSIKEDGNSARAVATIKDEKAQLTMQRDASGRWRVVAIEDDRLAGIIVDSARQNLFGLGTR